MKEIIRCLNVRLIKIRGEKAYSILCLSINNLHLLKIVDFGEIGRRKVSKQKKNYKKKVFFVMNLMFYKNVY